jgi:hypothetical protein
VWRQVAEDVAAAGAQGARVAWVLPAFQTVHATGYPTTKADTVTMLYNGTLQPFLFAEKVRAHYATAYVRWADARAAFVVPYSWEYEPYVAVHATANVSLGRDALALQGYGVNKVCIAVSWYGRGAGGG